MTSSTASDDRYTISQREHNRMCRQSELQLAISYAIDKKVSAPAETAFGKFTKEDVVLVLSRMCFEWAQRLPKKR